ncbi:MAG: alcohol dehydrogenase catalytic domain-containing protein [Verrucomicrobia bacterium]|nr:alcohol dehydrogenase catalytic domain-containing protein [Verrucomicrobiota bacterium]
MFAARLHGPRDLRVERVPHPGAPGRGQVLLRVKATGICGSDLHSYLDARIGDTAIGGPLILGHEFSAVVEAVGPGSVDGHFQPLKPGTRMAVDPAQPCGHCESCEKGHPNLCCHLAFCGNYPYGGSLCEWLHMPARSCFPVSRKIDDESAALLEPLGVAIHAVDFAKLRVGCSVAILGAGPIGLLILQIAKLAGADPIFVTDKFPWRLKLAQKWGGIPIRCDAGSGTGVPPVRVGTGSNGRDACAPTGGAVRRVMKETDGRGVDVAIEAAWAEESVTQAAAMLRLGGRLVVVGISGGNRLELNASVARRKGLTIIMSRRMKHTYPRAIRLAETGRVDLHGLVSHRFPLKKAPEAFKLNTAYADGVVKVMLKS